MDRFDKIYCSPHSDNLPIEKEVYGVILEVSEAGLGINLKKYKGILKAVETYMDHPFIVRDGEHVYHCDFVTTIKEN